jgi:hypothetical protein
MWDALLAAADVIDLIVRWRHNLSLFIGFVLGMLAMHLIPDPDLGLAVLCTLLVVAFFAGLVWEWTA